MRHPSQLTTLHARYRRQGGKLVTAHDADESTSPVLMYGPVAGALLFAKYHRADKRWRIMHGTRQMGLNTYEQPPLRQLQKIASRLGGY